MSWECRHVDRACITTTRWKPAEIRPLRGVRRPSNGCGRGTMRNSHSGIAREEPPPITNLTLAHDFDTCGSVVGAPVSFHSQIGCKMRTSAMLYALWPGTRPAERLRLRGYS